ncbi:hypothetical protein BCR32DRAFT_265782 [Anaeromyces robustus]|uniref:NodB homology domain-containing protein n=1 Tax=Anaeromyces robustus TaxID=1754192 RepID=A0A1Y1XHN0_9FUNG|nr:hypothetical protein BCR32DRAFT_265782 [Anaeromyces robustus]|eukprot:ORX85253.1 hypothetical protein BCR32DRAFT_265782 [Anaeromyces robustus]
MIMHKRNRSFLEKNTSDNVPQKYQLYNYDSLYWSWAHFTILITLGLLFTSNIFGDVISNSNNPYSEFQYREKINVSRSKKYSKRSVVEPFVECDESSCVLPLCKCPVKNTPNSIPYDKLPQFVLISVDSPITNNIYTVRNKAKEIMNGKFSEIPFTYFITGDHTDYYLAEKLYCENDEISIHTYNKNSFGNVPRDIQSLKSALNKLSNVPIKELRGFRSPQHSLHKNIFSNLIDLNIKYDSSLTLSLKDGYWPFTLDYGIPFLNDSNVEGESFTGLWEIPLLSIPNTVSKKASGTKNKGLVPSEHNINIIKNEFKRNYENEKLPFYLYFTEKSLKSSKNFINFYKEIVKYISEYSNVNHDIYFVTYNQLIEWMKNPIPINEINSLNKSKVPFIINNSNMIKFQKEPLCSVPNKCKYSSTNFSTCSKCPFQSPSPIEPNPYPLFIDDTKCDKQMPEGGCGNGMWECGCVCLNSDNNLDGYCINDDGQCYTPKLYDEKNDEYICSDNIISKSELVNGTRQIIITKYNNHN